jgi:DNA-binding CsgD family transcriptional regulator
VPETTLNAIVRSQHPLVRALLSEILRIRCGARIVARLGSLDHVATQLPSANVLVCDANGFSKAELGTQLERLSAQRPQLRLVTVEDSAGEIDVEEIVASVRGIHARAQASHERLTPLETEVMLAVAAGHRNADIARRMRRSSKTVEKHRANLLRKLGVRTVAQLTAYAIHNGLLRADAILQPRRQG